jgi:uncharacterized RDD family membrane protein YckC
MAREVMNTPNMGPTCPLCGKNKHMKKKTRHLYEHAVCKKCYYGFAIRRQFAFAIDITVWSCCLIVIQRLAILSDYTPMPLLFLIFCFKDGFLGYSLGKAMMGVQVVDTATGRPCDFMASFKRNILLIIPFMDLYVAFQLCDGPRIGDGWSNTGVIWKKHADKVPFLLE